MALVLKLLVSTCLFLMGLNFAYAACEPEISYPAPTYDKSTLQRTLREISKNLDNLIKDEQFEKTSFSLEISSSNSTLFTKYHTDKSLGGTPINGSSVYRIASGTKMFTALGILKQEALGKLNLDDEVTRYVSPLSHRHSKITWKGITIRSLLAHLGGLPDNCEYTHLICLPFKITDFFLVGDEDLLLTLPDPSVIGLPPIVGSQLSSLPKCGLYSNWTNPCTSSGMFESTHALSTCG